ncbi:MAG: hypothetical protein AAGH74_17025 [Pseudomonadota bacterium]
MSVTVDEGPDAPLEIEVEFTPSDLEALMTDRSLMSFGKLWGPVLVVVAFTLVLLCFFGDAAGKFIGGLVSDPLRAISGSPEMVVLGIGLLFAGIGVFALMIFVLVRQIQGARRATKTIRNPDTDEMPGLVPGLHYGPGIIEIGAEGIAFGREHYYALHRWGAIADLIDVDGVLGLQLISGAKIHYGRPFDPDHRALFAKVMAEREAA